MTDKQRLEALLHASQREVTRLSDVITSQAMALRHAQQQAETWERRFDKLLDKAR